VVSAEIKTEAQSNSAFLYLFLWGDDGEMPVHVVSTLIN
jgi:hypothetical protein